MTSFELILFPVLVSIAAFGSILASKRRRKLVWLIAACVAPSVPYLLIFLTNMRDYNSPWTLLLFSHVLVLSVAGNLTILALLWLMKRLKG